MHTANRAFTLAEMALVLTIIAVIAGGIVAGQGMLSNAQLAGAAAEMQRYRTAAFQFRDAYNAWPGDFAGATALWGAAGGSGTGSACFTLEDTTKATCNGNGDGWINASSSNDTDLWYFGERFHAWKHLANAGLIEGRFTGRYYKSHNLYNEPGVNSPESVLKNGTWRLGFAPVGDVYSRDGNDFEGSANFVAPGKQGGIIVIPLKEAQYYDTKLDDGLPGTGLIVTNPNCDSNSTDKYAARYANSATVNCKMFYLLKAGDGQ